MIFSIQTKRYVYVRNLFVFLITFFSQQYSFGQGTQHISGDLTFNFFGYPTLYGLDSITHDRFLAVFEAKRLKHKYKSLENEFKVYHELKEISWQEYPCVEVGLKDLDSTIFVFMNLEDYHKIIAENQEQLDRESQKVALQLSIIEIIPGYYRLFELENLEFVNNPNISRDKFAKMDYVW